MGRSSYPNLIDSDVEIPRVENNISEIGGEAINSLRDAIFSIEEAIGINPQGSVADLVTRINVSLDSNGNIKLSELSQRGLVTLPIVNAQIASNAAIVESKLNLDYTTSALNSRILTNVTDIDTVRSAFNTFSGQTTQHFTGAGNRHDGYDIDLTVSIRGNSDVESIVNTLNNALTNHEGLISNAHTAYGISVSNEFNSFSANNVQDALLEIDRVESSGIERHQDKMHETSVALNKRGEQGTQGNLKETTFAGTIYQTNETKSTDIFQVMRPNVARVTSEDINLRALQISNSQNLRVQAGGCGRGVIDIDLSAVIPTDDLDIIVSEINTKAQSESEHYPISAYNTGGKLTIAHNIPGYQFTIQVLNTVQFSAATALGFSQVTATTFEWSGDEHFGYIGGKRISDFKSIIKKHHVHSNSPTNTMALGLGDLSVLGLTISNEGRVLCNITNHSSSSSVNGTYYIISFPDNETFVLSENITLGTFDIEIVADSVNFSNSSNGMVYDVFVEDDGDGYGIVTKSSRVSYGPISGVDLRTISEDFPTSNIDWEISGGEYIQILENNIGGVTTEIPTGFLGQLKVFAPDNINSALFEITGAPSSSKKNINASTFSGTSDKLHIGSIHYSGNHGLTTLKYATDNRKLGGSITSKSEDQLSPVLLEDINKELRNNGIIRGFDIISSGSSSFRVRGGRALVNGRLVDVKTQNITINDFSTATNLLLLDRNGNFLIKNEFDAGYSFDELTSGDAYGDNMDVAIICGFDTDDGSIDGYFVDRRLMVGNIDKRLIDSQASVEQKIEEVRSTAQGSMWGFTIAEASGGGSGDSDGYLAGIEVGSNNGFSYIPYDYETPTSASGFQAGSALITTRRFEFSDSDTITTSVFGAPGLTHINVFVEAIYTGIESGVSGPFGVSGTVYVEVGVAVERGMVSLHVNEAYARVKTINSGVLASDSLTERYVASIPVAQLELPENVMFDVVPRVRIVNSNYVDGGTSDDNEPTIRFDNIRVVTSSYSIAGSINEVDGSSEPVAAVVGEIL